MSDLAELVTLARELGLTGDEAKAFVKEQQDHQREEEQRRKEEHNYELKKSSREKRVEAHEGRTSE